MSLKKYNTKRKFKLTPEPPGKKPGSTGPLRFVVQKHRASRLHYDFRLELDGVLASWAVPKGPSLNPDDKRLAVMVEDHPLDYQSFEGVIPNGNYGAGTVMIWDEGVYSSRETTDPQQSQKILRAGLKKGHITFVLVGEKLKGEFALIKIRNDSRSQAENSWLLVKAGDEFASHDDILAMDCSAASGRTMDEITAQAEKKGEIWISTRNKKETKDPGTRDPKPANVRPMLAVTVEGGPFDREGWLFEIKWDGYRALAETGASPKLYSRNLLPFESRFPKVFEEVRRLKLDAVLDGEIVALGENGLPSFQLLQDYESNPSSRLTYNVFDILFLEGRLLTGLPLKERKSILKGYLPKNSIIRYSDHVEYRGRDFFRLAEKKGLEGVIAKDGESVYLPGRRSKAWIKIKARKSLEAVIAGFTQPRGGRNRFGSLVLGVYVGERLVYAGHTGSGFDEKTLDSLYKKLLPLKTKTAPFNPPPKTNMPVTWVKPKLVAEVNFTEWTSDGRLRHPIYKGLREDKSPRQAQMDDRMETAQTAVESTLIIGAQPVPVTNLNKVYWPKEGYTKGDLIEYYRKVKKLILPHLKDRPQTLHRFPNGIEGQAFYQKDMKQAPDWVPTTKIRHEDKTVNYLLVQDEASLVYLANLGCIEIHPFNSKAGRIEYPDYMVIDLDPEAVQFDKVRETALMVHELLDEIGIPNFCKTSGATGIHIYAPLGAKYDYSQVKQFCKIVATLGNRRLPEITSITRSPSKRQGRVYLDYLQNNRGQTLASAYSLRPYPKAPVSTPLDWKEVKKKFDPAEFNIKTVLNRIQKTGDLFKPVLGRGVDLIAGLNKLEKIPR